VKPLLEVSDLRVDIGRLNIVDGMSFELQAGQVFGLAGVAAARP
jgi:ABC-type multidrug transport system ATPase subunit